MIRAALTVALLLTPVVAFAGKSDADSCAKALPQEARVIYDNVAPMLTPASNIKDVLTENTRKLAMAGKVSRSTARGSATTAGECMKKMF